MAPQVLRRHLAGRGEKAQGVQPGTVHSPRTSESSATLLSAEPRTKLPLPQWSRGPEAEPGVLAVCTLPAPAGRGAGAEAE
jgi:hypothetical protein